MAGEIIRPKDLPPKSDINPNARIAADDGARVFGPTIAEAVGRARPFATQPQAAEGTSTTATMNPLTTKQSIASEVGISLASYAQGAKADTAVQPEELAAVATSGQYDDLAGRPIIPPGLADGDKGDISVSSNGTVWGVNRRFDTVAALLADSTMGYAGSGAAVTVGAGGIVEAGDFRYEVAASGAAGAWLLTTAGGVKLEVAGFEPELAAFGGVNDRTTPNDAAFAKLRAHAIKKGYPAFIRGHGYLLTQEHQLEEGLWLFAVDGGVVTTDNTLRSVIYVGNSGVQIDGLFVEMPVSIVAGAVGIGVLLRGNGLGAKLRRVKTRNGKIGIAVLDADDVQIDDCLVQRSDRWGFLMCGARNTVLNRCRVETTTGTTANDCFKVVGVNPEFSTQSAYNVWINDCYGEGAGAGQVIDIISVTDSLDDIHHVYVNNIHGRNCANGMLEIKANSITTNYMHNIHVNGGSYSGSGSEVTGFFFAGRVDSCTVRGVIISDVQRGVVSAGAGRRNYIEVEVSRARQTGYEWGLYGPGNRIKPRVVDANYDNAANTYSAIELVGVLDDLIIEDPYAVVSSSPGTSAHRYGINFGVDFVGVKIEGTPVFSGHSHGQWVKGGGSGVIEWPQTYRSGVIDLAANAAGISEIFSSHEFTFEACAVSLVYVTNSNVARTVTARGRGTTGTTDIASPLSSSSAATAQRDLTQLGSPVELTRARQCFQVSLGAVTLPGSPAGKVIVEVHGYMNGANFGT